ARTHKARAAERISSRGHQQQEGVSDDTTAAAASPDGSSSPARSQATRHSASRAPLAGHQQPTLAPARNTAWRDPARLASAATQSDSVSAAARCAGRTTRGNTAMVSHHAPPPARPSLY